jgi:hypothetical protein
MLIYIPDSIKEQIFLERYIARIAVKNKALGNFLASAMTFRTCKAEKVSFIVLNWLDLCLTMFAMTIGAHELNPLMRGMFGAPILVYAAKIVIPLFFSWLLPGKVLIPSIGLLVLVAAWNIKELLVYFF